MVGLVRSFADRTFQLRRALRGRCVAAESVWAFDDDGDGRALEIVLPKADRSVWAGVFAEEEAETPE